jgi:hypothetical protein
MPSNKKIIEYLAYKEDLWPLGYDIDRKNGNFCESIQQL